MENGIVGVSGSGGVVSPVSGRCPDGESDSGLFERASVFYEKTLPDSPGASDLAVRLGLPGGVFGELLRAGWSDGSLVGALPDESDVVDRMLAAGLLRRSGGCLRETLLGHLTVPVILPDGSFGGLAGVHGRTLRERWLPGESPSLFNVRSAQFRDEVVLVSRILEVLILDACGFGNAVAFHRGRNGRAPDFSVLAKSGVKGVVLLRNSGFLREPWSVLSESLSAHFAVRTVDAASEGGLSELMAGHGKDGVVSLIGNASSAAASPESPSADGADRFRIRVGPREYEIVGLERSPRSLKATVRTTGAGLLHVDTVDLYNSRSRRRLAADVGARFGADAAAVGFDLDELVRACEARTSGRSAVPCRGVPGMSPEDEADAFALGRSEDLAERILSDFESCGLVGEETNKLLCYVAMTSRKTDRPLSVLILSGSGAGKSALQDAALGFCPPEDLVKVTGMSGKALFHKGKESLKHKVLAFEEGAGAEDAAYALRVLISAGELSSEITARDPATGALTTVRNTVEGPTSVFCTTACPEVDPETRSRFIVTGIDESREQTRRILAEQVRRQGPAGLGSSASADRIVRVHRNFQRLLKPCRVMNPFADRIACTDDRLHSRRALPQYLGLIAATAFLRQMGKERKILEGEGGATEYVEVDELDMALADRIAREILGRSLDELSLPARDLLGQIGVMLEARKAAAEGGGGTSPRRHEIAFTRREIMDFTGWRKTRLHVHLRELIEMELVLHAAGGRNVIQTYRLIHDGTTGEEDGCFPPPPFRTVRRCSPGVREVFAQCPDMEKNS